MFRQIVRDKSQYVEPFDWVQKMNTGSFKNVVNKMCLQIIYI